MVRNQDLFAFGKEFSEIQYENFWDWFVQVGDVGHYWKNQPTYIISQVAFLFGGIATLIHALRNGGRLPYLWLATLLHGVVVECMAYAVPDIDNFWHSQTPIIFLGHRLPLHIIMLYPCFIYQASIGVEKLNLPSWARPFAVGLCVVLIDIPYDIVSVNFLHWTWHDTDPNIADRHYWVPWNSYYFHASFAAAFTFWYHMSRKWFKTNQKKQLGSWEALSCGKEFACTIIAALLGTPSGILLFVVIYHPLHDIFGLHTEVTFFMLFTVFLLIIWSGDRQPKALQDQSTRKRIFRTTPVLVIHLVLHYLSFMTIVTMFKPEKEVAIGLKEPIGPCNEYTPVQTIFGMTLKKRKYLCATDYDEKYFDWTCLPGGKAPQSGSIWYTACGVPLPNTVEYIAIVTTILLVAFVTFKNMHCQCKSNIPESTIAQTKKRS